MIERIKMFKRISFVVLSAAFCVTLTGCVYPKPNPMQSDGIPMPKYLVGGGFQLKYTAPVDGTLYVADSHSSKMLITESLKADDTFEQTFDLADRDTKDGLKALGIELSAAKLQLYFIPDTDMPIAKKKRHTPKDDQE